MPLFIFLSFIDEYAIAMILVVVFFLSIAVCICINSIRNIRVVERNETPRNVTTVRTTSTTSISTSRTANDANGIYPPSQGTPLQDSMNVTRNDDALEARFTFENELSRMHLTCNPQDLPEDPPSYYDVIEADMRYLDHDRQKKNKGRGFATGITAVKVAVLSKFQYPNLFPSNILFLKIVV